MVVGRAEAGEGTFLVEVGGETEGDFWEEVACAIIRTGAGAKGKADGDIGAFANIVGFGDEAF